MQVVFPALPGIAALHLNADAGLLLPLGARAWNKPTSISDRFFLGGMGAGSLRGFMHRGVGPSEVRRPQRDESAEAEGSAGQDNVSAASCCRC